MKFGKRIGVAAVITGLAVAGAVAAPTASASSGSSPGSSPGVAKVVTKGLDGPFGLAGLGSGFVVAENVSGEVTKVDRYGHQRVVLPDAPGVAGVAAGGHYVYSALGGSDETGAPPAGAFEPTSVLSTNLKTHKTRVLANLLRYELKKNPDRQKQFDKNKQPYDTLSNPFAMTKFWGGLLVADGGGNDVILVNPRTGHPRTFFVPPTVKDVKACLEPGAQSNPGTVGCDPVPTGVVYAHGSVYVSTLGAEVPGAGRVYKLNARTGKVQRVWKGLDSPTGVAVGHNGTVYVSQVFYGAPEGPPSDDFDPSTVGRIIKIAPNGKRTQAQVTMPTGLLVKGGHLYATAWSVASFLGIEHAGQIVKVKGSAFH
jgi:hypothetical protein